MPRCAERVDAAWPRTYACVEREKVVAPITNAIANRPAFSWIQRENPFRIAACWGRVLPAMKPATHAIE